MTPNQKKAYEQIPSLEKLEIQHIRYVLSITSTATHAAKILGINMSTLWRKKRKYRIEG